MSDIGVFNQFPSVFWFGAFGDFVSAILSFIVLFFIQMEYKANKFLRHKDQLHQLEKDVMNVEDRLVHQSNHSSFSALVTKFLCRDSLEDVLDTFPDLKRFALLYEEIIVRTDYNGYSRIGNFNKEFRESLRRKLTRNEIALLARLEIFCPKANIYFNS